MSEEQAPYNAGLGGSLDEEEVRESVNHALGHVAKIQENISRIKCRLAGDDEVDMDKIRDRLNRTAYRLRQAANDVDPGP